VQFSIKGQEVENNGMIEGTFVGDYRMSLFSPEYHRAQGVKIKDRGEARNKRMAEK